MVTETSGTRTGTLDSEYKNIGIIPIYFVLHWLLGLGRTVLYGSPAKLAPLLIILLLYHFLLLPKKVPNKKYIIFIHI